MLRQLSKGIIAHKHDYDRFIQIISSSTACIAIKVLMKSKSLLENLFAPLPEKECCLGSKKCATSCHGAEGSSTVENHKIIR